MFSGSLDDIKTVFLLFLFSCSYFPCFFYQGRSFANLDILDFSREVVLELDPNLVNDIALHTLKDSN